MQNIIIARIKKMSKNEIQSVIMGKAITILTNLHKISDDLATEILSDLSNKPGSSINQLFERSLKTMKKNESLPYDFESTIKLIPLHIIDEYKKKEEANRPDAREADPDEFPGEMV